MPSIGVDLKSGRGWGVTNQAEVHAINLGCVCFWWLSGASIVDQLRANLAALTAARAALKTQQDQLKNATIVYRASDGRFLPFQKDSV